MEERKIVTVDLEKTADWDPPHYQPMRLCSVGVVLVLNRMLWTWGKRDDVETVGFYLGPVAFVGWRF